MKFPFGVLNFLISTTSQGLHIMINRIKQHLNAEESKQEGAESFWALSSEDVGFSLCTSVIFPGLKFFSAPAFLIGSLLCNTADHHKKMFLIPGIVIALSLAETKDGEFPYESSVWFFIEGGPHKSIQDDMNLISIKIKE